MTTNLEINESAILNGLLWKLIERGGSQGVQFIIQLFLARLLSPEDFGIIAIVLIFINITSGTIQYGVSTALIQRKSVDSIAYSSMLIINLVIAILIIIILFLIAPILSYVYGYKQIIPLLRTLSLVVLPGSIYSILLAKTSRELDFKKVFISSVIASILSGIISIFFALNGYGVWSLVIFQLLNQLICTIILWLLISWRPDLKFSYSVVKDLFSFGWKILLSSIIDISYREIRSLIIGKKYSISILGYYNRGQQFPQLIIGNINASIQAVMLPVLSNKQDEPSRMKEMMRRSIITSSFFIFPLMIGLVVIAEPLIALLLTEKWIPAVPFLQIFCVSFALWPIHTANLQAINAMGRSDIYLKLEIVKKVVGMFILVITLFMGIYALVLGEVLAGIISSFINAYPNKNLLNYGYLEQLKDVLPSLCLSAVMGFIISLIYLFNFTYLVTIIIQIVMGIFIYLSLAKIFKFECLTYLLNSVSSLLIRKEIMV
jgi:O-antigen/teichoic acid export membrane protein